MIVLAYDHGGTEMFKNIKAYLTGLGLGFIECASAQYNELDSFVDFAKPANEYVKTGYIGIYGCKSGIGMSIAANKGKGVRAALCINPKFAEMARKHNNANVCVIPCEYIKFDQVKEILDAFLGTEFLGGKYQDRNDALDNLE